jgi:hypothetical protein
MPVSEVIDIAEFAAKCRVKTRTDSCGETIIPGKPTEGSAAAAALRHFGRGLVGRANQGRCADGRIAQRRTPRTRSLAAERGRRSL